MASQARRYKKNKEALADLDRLWRVGARQAALLQEA
jgi:hypothetical protein